MTEFMATGLLGIQSVKRYQPIRLWVDWSQKPDFSRSLNICTTKVSSPAKKFSQRKSFAFFGTPLNYFCCRFETGALEWKTGVKGSARFWHQKAYNPRIFSIRSKFWHDFNFICYSSYFHKNFSQNPELPKNSVAMPSPRNSSPSRRKRRLIEENFTLSVPDSKSAAIEDQHETAKGVQSLPDPDPKELDSALLVNGDPTSSGMDSTQNKVRPTIKKNRGSVGP